MVLIISEVVPPEELMLEDENEAVAPCCRFDTEKLDTGPAKPPVKLAEITNTVDPPWLIVVIIGVADKEKAPPVTPQELPAGGNCLGEPGTSCVVP